MDRSAQIARIIEKRRPLVQKIELVEANLRSLDSALRDLEFHRNHLLTRTDESTVIRNLRDIDFATIQSKIAAEQEAIAKLKARFARKTLNIGVVGRAGQGKSRFLQSLTGLTNEEIPDGKLNNCTGVGSTIQHNPNVETYGEVYFHTERSFLDEIIYPYYDQIQLGTKPFTVDEFASKPLPPLPSTFVGLAEPGAMYARLLKCQENLDKYRTLLGALSPRRIEKGQIRGFVAQTSLDGRPIFFNYLAVREVKIVCPFPNADVGRVALIDLPGLGDTALGDKERLKKTVGQDADFVLFLYMPQMGKRLWEDVDVQLYDTARSALVDLPIEKWSFMLLNRTAGGEFSDNLEYCQEAARIIAEKHIAVKEHMIANCADPEEASQVLDRILTYLEANITSLDEQYLSANKANHTALENEIKAEMDKARNALGATHSDRWYREFVTLFNKFWKNITSGLQKLLVELDSFRDEEDADFHQRVNDVVQFCLANTGILLDANNEEAKKLIEDLNYELGDYGKTYFECMNRLRTHLSRQFLSLDDALKYSVEKAKSRVTDVLVDKGKGNLGELTQARGSEFLKEIAELLPEDLTRLKQGFEILSTFEISYRGLIQHRIRQHLDELTPNRNLDLPFDASLSPEKIQISILEALDEFYKAGVRKCENALNSFLSEPNQAAFAMVEEFVDQVLRAEGVQDEWRIFLEEMRSDIWPDEFDRLGERTHLRQEWLHLVERAANANQLDSI
jgi:energy-coupling factor transporter ATP-binding protein EcfA2